MNQSMIGHIALAFAWLGFLAIANRQASQPVVSIFPYLTPVVFFAWVYGARWGLLISGFATLAAIPDEFLSFHSKADFLYAGLTTYVQLTAAVIAIVAVKAVRSRSGRC